MHRTQNPDKPICVQLHQSNYFFDWRLSPSSFRTLKESTSSMCQLLLARLSVCPCQVQVRSQGSKELLQVANDWAFPESPIHARFLIFHLKENMAAPEGIPCVAWFSRLALALGTFLKLLNLQFFIRNRNRWLVTCRYKNNGLLFLIDVFCMLPVFRFRGGGVAAYLASSEDGERV